MANNDNAMTRFLFAILKQKNLKDIDWNEVARDPILAQPITNGHAARMRYSRFKQSMLGLEPQKRSKGGVTKSKSTKQKKDYKDSKKEDNIKSEAGLDTPFGKLGSTSPQKIKQEHAVSPFPLPFAATSAASPVVESAREVGLRLLTPCSDDMLAETASLAMSPAPTFNLGPCPHGDGQESANSHDGWDHTSLYFENAYGLDQFASPLCEHQHDPPLAHASDLSNHDSLLHEHTHDFAATSGTLLQAGITGHTPIKHESWDSRGH